VSDAEALFTAHHRQIVRYLNRAVGHTETARDLAQEVFLRVARTPAPASNDGERRAWLFRIARNLAIDHQRQQHRRPETPLAAAPVERPAAQDVGAAVNEALATLADLDRDVFLLREAAGLSYDEIAETCDLTTDAVRARIHRARLHLRDRLAAPIAERRQHPMRRDGRPTRETP